MALVKIGSVSNVVSGVVEPTRQNGVAFGKENGEWKIGNTFPGISQVVMSKEDMETFIATLIEVAGLDQSDRPGAVFARSVTVDAEGNVVGRFSDKARARSLTIPKGEIDAFIGLMIERLDSWDDYVSKVG